MKSKFLVTVFSILFINAQSTRAQLLAGSDTTMPKVGFGVKAGANIQTITGDVWDHGAQAGFSGGFFVRMYKKKFGGRAEVLYTGSKITSDILTDSAGHKGEFRTSRIEIPVLLEYQVIPRLSICAGLQYDNLISVKNITDISGDIKKIFRQSEFSAVAGIEVKLPYRISAGARYRMGFTNINNETISGMPGSWTTQAIQLFACYTIK